MPLLPLSLAEQRILNSWSIPANYSTYRDDLVDFASQVYENIKNTRAKYFLPPPNPKRFWGYLARSLTGSSAYRQIVRGQAISFAPKASNSVAAVLAKYVINQDWNDIII